VTYPRDRETESGTSRYCPTCSTWKRRDGNFYSFKEPRVRSGVAWRRQCIPCERLRKTPHGGFIPIARIQPILHGMIEQCGYRETARRIGVSPVTVSYWLHDIIPHHGKPHKRVTRAKAALIVAARVQLNKDISAGRVKPVTEHAMRKNRKRRGLCVGCGGQMHEYTEGCYACMDRKSKRKQRGLQVVPSNGVLTTA